MLSLPTADDDSITIASPKNAVNASISNSQTFPSGADMLRLRINELLAEYNRDRPREERIRMQDIANAVDVPRGTLSGLTTYNRRPVTNSAYLEALIRYFSVQLGFGNRWPELFEFEPVLDQTETVIVDELYPERAARTPTGRRARGGEGGQQ